MVALAAVAGADDQHAVGRAVRQQRHMRQHLLVDELVALGDLHDAVEQHDAAVRVALEDHDVLERALNAREFTPDQESLSPLGIQRLVHPRVGGHRDLPAKEGGGLCPLDPHQRQSLWNPLLQRSEREGLTRRLPPSRWPLPLRPLKVKGSKGPCP